MTFANIFRKTTFHHGILFNYRPAFIDCPAFLAGRQSYTTIPIAWLLSCGLGTFEGFSWILEIVCCHGTVRCDDFSQTAVFVRTVYANGQWIRGK